ncbi:RTA1-domain-containing protein [Auriculariales sp. MPI-PUGE-AT-0066]|nr:RTA1-domain-containing protein [Auriculariales sp. MPI-PUGE-AT-0066]
MASRQTTALAGVIAVCLLLRVAPTALARPAGLVPGDPYADPRHDVFNPLRYIASNILTAIAVALVLVVGFAQTFFVWKYKTKWMLAMTIGCYTFAIGLALRFGLHSDPHGRGLYIAEYLFVVLSPCAFIAAEYVLLGRLARFLRADQHLLVSPQKITRVFVTSDIVTFLIQACGGAISASARTDPKKNELGSHLFLAGLAAQLFSFVVFLGVFTHFLIRLYKHEPATWRAPKWKTLLAAMSFSFIGILIRSVFRTIELSEGFAGPLATSEKHFYGLDTLPLFIAIAIYVPFWPGRYIRTPESRLELRPEDQVAASEKSSPAPESDHTHATAEGR